MKSEWKINTNIFSNIKIFGVYRILDENEIDHSGNRETYGYYKTREEAEKIAAELNNNSGKNRE